MLNYKLLTKITSIIILILTIVNFITPSVYAITGSGSGTWTGGQFATRMITTDSDQTDGIYARRLTNVNTGEKLTVFCAEHGVSFATGTNYNGTYYNSTDSRIKKACKIAYFGWYSKDDRKYYVMDGGITAPEMIYLRWEYAFTQQYIWEALGQSNATFTGTEQGVNLQGAYEDFKRGIDNKIAEIEKRPSFDGQTINIEIGQEKTITDDNNAFKDYNSINVTEQGVQISHTKGENTLKLKATENASTNEIIITDSKAKEWGLIKEDTQDNQTSIYFEFTDGVQNQLYSFHYNDPVTTTFSIQTAQLKGSLELSKTDASGRLIDGAVFTITGPNGYNQDVTITGGKKLIENLSSGTYTIKEKTAPSGYIVDTKTYTANVTPNNTAKLTITNGTATGNFTLTKTNKDGSKKLQGVKYRFWNDSSYDNTFTTDANGQIKITGLALGTYNYQEIETISPYTVDNQKYTFTLSYKDQNTSTINESVTKTNSEATGGFTLTKTNADGDVRIEGVKYRIWNDSTNYNKTFTTDSNGEIKVTDLALGTYNYQEISTVEPYLIDNAVYQFTLSANNPNAGIEAKAVRTNSEASGTFILTKINEKEDRLSGVTYRIWSEDSKIRYDKTFETDGIGQIIVNGLKLGTYKYQEQNTIAPYLLDDAVYTFELSYENQTTSVVKKTATQENKEPTGTFTLTKKNADKSANIRGVTYRIWSDDEGNNFNQTFVTDINGQIQVTGLKLGNYKYQEQNTVYGYLLDDTIYSFQVNYKDQYTPIIYVDVIQTNDEPTGTIELEKRDTKIGNVPQGDGQLKQAVYRVYADEDIYNVAKTRQYYKKNDLIEILNTNEQGFTPAITELPLGKYRIKEDSPSVGYLIDNTTYYVNLQYKDQVTRVITDHKVSLEKVKERKIHVFKSGIKVNTGETPGLRVSEFTIKLQSDVDKALARGYSFAEIFDGVDEKGNQVSVNPTRVQQAQEIAPTYERLVTDDDGNAYSTRYFPYGTYFAVETRTPQDYESAVFTFSIMEDESEIADNGKKVKDIVVNDEQQEMYIKLVKLDKKTNKYVTFGSTTFQIIATTDIYDRATGAILYKKGEPVTQKIGSVTFNTFTTNADNMVVPDRSYTNAYEDKATVVVPLKLEVGSYEVREVRTPTGFLELEEPIKFNVDGIRHFGTDDDGDFTRRIVMKNEQPTGTLIINKSINLRNDVDKSLVDASDLRGIQFTLRAKEDVIDYADGNIIYFEGQDIRRYNLNKNGYLRIDNLPMGHYEIYESKVIDGLVLNSKVYDVNFVQQDLTTKVYTKERDIENDTTVTEISKQDITESKELEGAKLTILDKTGRVVDSWTSTDKPHKIEGLTINTNYILREEIAPRGYVKSTDIEFTIQNTKEIQKVKMIDKVVDMTKLNFAGEEIVGAYIKVFDMANNLVDEWVSGTEPHKINNLVEGKTYVMHEEIAPNGYVCSTDVEFKITTDKETQHEKMTDKIVEMYKKNFAGEEISGAKIQVKNKDGKIVDEWTSTKEPHRINNLRENETYVMHEETAPNGYVCSTDVEFKVTTDKETQKIEMIDKIVEMYKKNFAGDEIEGAKIQVFDKNNNLVDEWISTTEPHKINNLREDETYILHEEIAPEGYVIATDVEFKVTTEKETQKVEMTDKIVEMYKRNFAGDEIEGAKIQVFDKNNNVVDEWVSSKEPHRINNLKEKETYILHEEIAPDGYVIATDIEFYVTENKETQETEMIDKIVEMDKKNIDDENIEFVKMQVIDKNNNILDEWDSSKESHKINGLKEGEIYTLHEEIQAKGYVKAKDIKFKVSFDKQTQKVAMIDKIVEMYKQNVDGENIIGATIQVLDRETKEVIDEWETKENPHRINNLVEGETYILHEEKVADSYVKATDFEFDVTYDKQTQTIIMIDKIFDMSKLDVAGNEIDGATIQVIDQDGNIVDEWISSKEPHKIKNLVEGGNYILHEEIAKDGYVKATDIEFVVNYQKVNQHIEMVDKIVDMSKLDVAGEEIEGATIQVIDKDGKIVDEWVSEKEPHKINNLVEGETYVLHEEIAKEGYVKATDVEFEVTFEKVDQHIDMIDKIVDMSKLDVAGNEIEGATIQVLDKDGKIVDEWVSEKEPHKINNLVEGEKYILHEEIAKEGYVKATDVEFEVTFEKVDQHIEMTDKIVSMTKTDITNGEELEGAKLIVTDKDGKIVDEWISTKEPHNIKNLKENEKYTLTEITAPYGFEIAEKIEFEVTEEKINQHIEMKDKPILTDVRVIKIDNRTKETINSKFTFGIYEDEQCTKLIKEVQAENTSALFEKLRYGVYFIKELKAPENYKISNKIVKIEINDKGVFADSTKLEENNKEYSFKFENERILKGNLPQTGDTRNIVLYVMLFAISTISLIGAIVIFKRK